MNISQSVPATYGHGTHNDFVLIFDPDDLRSVTTAQTQASGLWITEIQMALWLKCVAMEFE